jgi:Ca-activated chloride channel family protein
MWPISALSALEVAALGVEAPGLLLAGLASVALALLVVLARGPRRLRVPSAGRDAASARPRPDLAFLLSVALRGAALALLVVAASRPVGLVPENPAGGSGVDLVVALDASGSMLALDGQLDGRQVTRLELAKSAVSDFVRARSGDRIGLVAFGEHAFTLCPLTVDHRLVQESLARVEAGLVGDATAVGEAIGLGTQRLSISGGPEDGQRILVLVTDGRHNSGKLAPQTAAELATRAGVRIHAVGVGTSGLVPFAQPGAGTPMRFERVDLDRATLQSVAASTGGHFFHARRPEDLSGVAAAIDRLEARPGASEPKYRHASLAPLTLSLALALLLAEAALAHGLLRRLP